MSSETVIKRAGDMSKVRKPIVYIASPYTRGDPAINTRFQCEVFDQLMNDGRCVPIAPLWSHFQHVMFPRAYQDWIAYDLELIRVCDACVRLNAEHARLGYRIDGSTGADGEVARFRELGKPVFFSLAELGTWLSEAAAEIERQLEGDRQ